MSLPHLLKHPLFLLVLGAAGTVAMSAAVSAEVGKARDDHQDVSIAAVKADVSHMKDDLDQVGTETAQAQTRMTSMERESDRLFQELRTLREEVQSADDCLRTACWRRADP